MTPFEVFSIIAIAFIIILACIGAATLAEIIRVWRYGDEDELDCIPPIRCELEPTKPISEASLQSYKDLVEIYDLASCGGYHCKGKGCDGTKAHSKDVDCTGCSGCPVALEVLDKIEKVWKVSDLLNSQFK